MKITIRNISERPQVLDLTKIIAFRTVISSGNSYSLNLREDKVASITEFLKDNEIFNVLGNEPIINEVSENKEEKNEKVIEETKEIKLEKELEVKTEKSVEEITEVKETKTDSKKKSSKKKSK